MRLTRRKFLVASVLFAFAICMWTFFIWRDDISGLLAQIGVYFRDSLHFLQDVPLICYSLVILILPVVFLPVTPVFILAAARAETDSYFVVLLYCWLGVTLNIVLSYFLSRRFGTVLREKLAARKIRVPEVPEDQHYELTLLMRMIPGNPLAVQNYVLGIANVNFTKYVIVSLPIQFIQVAAYVYFGEGIFQGAIAKLVLGSSFLLVIAIIAKMADKRWGYKLRCRKNGISAQ